MGWRSDWSRHYDVIQWTATTILTGIIGALLAYSYSLQVGKLDGFVSFVGLTLTWLTVYYAASFRELRQRLHATLEEGEEKLFLTALPHGLKQWPAFLTVFAVLAAAWVWLHWKHGWHFAAYLLGACSVGVFVLVTCRGSRDQVSNCMTPNPAVQETLRDKSAPCP